MRRKRSSRTLFKRYTGRLPVLKFIPVCWTFARKRTARNWSVSIWTISRHLTHCTSTIFSSVCYSLIIPSPCSVLNHGTQEANTDLSSLPSEQWLNTFDTNIHPLFYICKARAFSLHVDYLPSLCVSRRPYRRCRMARPSRSMRPSTWLSVIQSYSTTPPRKVLSSHSCAHSATRSSARRVLGATPLPQVRFGPL